MKNNIHCSRFQFFAAVFLLSIATSANAAPVSDGAVTIVAPGAAASMEGDTYNVYPFSLYPDGYYQQLYDASLFGGQSGVVNQILFRIDGSAFSDFTSAHNIEVRLSHTSVTPATMSTTFADNIGTDETVVL